MGAGLTRGSRRCLSCQLRGVETMCRTIALLAFTIGMVGCDFGEHTSASLEPLSATVRLTDTLGNDASTFRAGECFDTSFTLTNITGTTLTFYKGDGGPYSVFKIWRGDSIVATSVDGYASIMVAITGHLEPGHSLQAYWRAPNTPPRMPKIVLSPGLYEVRASVMRFDEVAVNQVPPIPFSIVQ